MKKTTKTLNMLIALLMALLMLPSFPVLAEDAQTVAVPANDNPLALDIVILIDQSSRMVDASGKGADPEGYRMDAAMIMLSMCDVEYSNAAIDWFGAYYGYNSQNKNKSELFRDLCILGCAPDKELMRLNTANRGRFNNMLTNEATINSSAGGGLVGYRPGSSGVYKEMRDNWFDDDFSNHNGFLHFPSVFKNAVNILAESENGNRKVILIISAADPRFFDDDELKRLDGQAFSYDTMKEIWNNKKDEYSFDEGQPIFESKQLANEKGIEIYVIDVNTSAGGASAGLLSKLDSRGEPNYIESIEDLPPTMNRIFAYLIGSELYEQAEEGKINVPNESVQEVNIIVPKSDSSFEGEGNITLETPPKEENSEGEKVEELATKNPEKYIITDSRFFRTYKIVAPEPGEYTVKCDDDVMAAEVQYVFSYDVVAEPSLMVKGEKQVDGKSFDKSEPFTVETVFTKDGSKKDDELLYTSITATLVINKINDNGKKIEVASIKMHGNKDEQKFELISTEHKNLSNLSAGTYEFVVKLSGAGLEREERIGEYTLVNNAPKEKEELSPEASDKETDLTGFIYGSEDSNDNNMGEVEINLDDYFADPDGDKCSYSIVEGYNKEVVTAKLDDDGKTLTITPKENEGEEIVTIECKDDDDEEPKSETRDFRVKVTDASGKYAYCEVELIVSVNGETLNGQTSESAGQTNSVKVHKGDKVTVTHNVTGTTQIIVNGEIKPGPTPELTGEEYIVTYPDGEPQNMGSNSPEFTAQNREGEYIVEMTGKLGDNNSYTKKVTITVENRLPELTADGEKLPDVFKGQLDGGGFILSLFGDQPEGTYWIDSKYLCSPTSDQTFDLSQYFTDPDGKEHDELKYTVSVYGPKGNDENVEEPLGEVLIENESIRPTEDGEETYLFTLKNDSFKQAGVHTVIFKAEDNDGASKEITLTLDVRSVAEKGKRDFWLFVLCVAIGGFVIAGIVKMFMPKFKPGMHFYIKKDGNRMNESEKELGRLRKPKKPYPMSRIWDSYYADAFEDAFKCLTLKPDYGNRIIVKATKTPPEDVQITVAGKTIENDKFQQKLTPYGSICFQRLDENGEPEDMPLEYVFMDRFE